jgi:RNA polymerase sigma-70 factor (ECF subfamily)
MTPRMEANREAYRAILRTARRFARSEAEACDLVQDALVVALSRGFDDWSSPERRGWLLGVVRRRAAFLFRTQVRRRRREQASDGFAEPGAGAFSFRPEFLASLPRSLRAVAVLASADLCAAEIRWLLGLTDTALRRRLSTLRALVRAEAETPLMPPREAPLALGSLRAPLLASLRRRQGWALATHDPDGHAILLRSQLTKKGGAATSG